jgi:hypothetical protein
MNLTFMERNTGTPGSDSLSNLADSEVHPHVNKNPSQETLSNHVLIEREHSETRCQPRRGLKSTSDGSKVR